MLPTPLNQIEPARGAHPQTTNICSIRPRETRRSNHQLFSSLQQQQPQQQTLWNTIMNHGRDSWAFTRHFTTARIVWICLQFIYRRDYSTEDHGQFSQDYHFSVRCSLFIARISQSWRNNELPMVTKVTGWWRSSCRFPQTSECNVIKTCYILRQTSLILDSFCLFGSTVFGLGSDRNTPYLARVLIDLEDLIGPYWFKFYDDQPSSSRAHACNCFGYHRHGAPTAAIYAQVEPQLCYICPCTIPSK